jgi:M6 family metalloprotease-like protein
MRKTFCSQGALLLALLTGIALLTSCSGKMFASYRNGGADGYLTTSSIAPSAPPIGTAIVKKDAPYNGPYRLPRDRWAYTADTIKEYQLEGKLTPGVYEANDPILGAALNSYPVPEDGKAASAGSPHDMNEDGMAAPKSGNLKVLIIKVKWANTSGQPIASTAAIQKKFFENGTDSQNISVKEFYGQQSYGALNISGDIYPQGADDAAYTLNGSPQWYGALVLISTNQAVALLDDVNPDINFADYDADNNGYVDAVIFVYQRFSGNNVSREHVGFIPTSAFYEADFTKDGKKILRGAFLDYTSFADYTSADYPWWEYTPHHEFGHILGMPDLYDYGGDVNGSNPGPDGDESGGAGWWDMMAAGSYALPAANISGPLKYCMGWTNADMITGNLKDFHLGPTNSSASNVRRVWRNGAEGEEYFILENNPTVGRQYIYYPGYVPSGDIYPNMTQLCVLSPGLLIWHVDERVWYKDRIFGDIEDWGWGCNDHEERKFIDLEESTATYSLNVPGSDGQVVDDKDYMGGKYDPWTDLYANANRFAPDTTPNSNAYVQFDDTLSYSTDVTVNNIRHDGTDAIIDVSIGAAYLHFPEPSPMILTGSADITPDAVENALSIDYYVNDVLQMSKTAAPWGFIYDTSSISFGNVSVRAVAEGTLPELSSETFLSYIVDNTPGAYPLVYHFEGTDEKLPFWASDITGGFKKQSGGFNSPSSFGVYDSNTPNYPNSLKSFAVLPRLALPGPPAAAPTLTFKTHYNLEDGMDIASVWISTDNFQSDWTQLNLRNGDPARLTGFVSDWTSTHVRLSNWAGQTVSVGFLLETNGSGCGQSTSMPAGWWIDQIVVANNWAEAVPFITSTGIPQPASFGAVYSKTSLLATIVADNNPTKVHYRLLTNGAPISGDLTAAPFDLNIDLSTMGNQVAMLELQALDSNNVGSPVVQIPVFIFNLRGDVNGDRVVNSFDRDALIPLLGLGSSDAGYMPWADADLSGRIDEADLAAIGYFWGGTI